MRRPALLCLSLCLALGPAGCRRKPPAAAPGDGGPAAVSAPQPAATAAPQAEALGQLDAFPRLPPAATKALGRGLKLLAARKAAAAVAPLREAVAAAPADLGARYQLARALAAGGPEDRVAAIAELRAVLQGDLLGYQGRLKGRDWQALLASPEGAALQPLLQDLRRRYAQGLAEGLVLVARTRPGRAAAPTRGRGASAGRVALQQEAYHFDPAQGRFRRLTDTGGAVLAALRSPGGEALLYLLVDRVSGGDVFLGARVAMLDLRSLELVGPFPLPSPLSEGDAALSEVRLGFSPQGQPQVELALGEAWRGRYGVDTARTGLGPIEGELEGAALRCTPRAVRYEAPTGGAQLSESGTGILLPGGDLVTATRALARDSLALSPGRGRLSYAARGEACAARRDPEAAMSELYIYEMAAKRAARIERAPGALRTLWLGEDVLAFDSGLDGRSAVQIQTLGDGKRQVLRAPYGAALHGLPLLACEDLVEHGGDAPPLAPAAPPRARPQGEDDGAGEGDDGAPAEGE